MTLNVICKNHAMTLHNSQTNLIKTLAALNQIGVRISRLGMGPDLPATLKLIAEGSVRAVAAGADPAAPRVSAVIWVYDEVRRIFEPESRVSAGEPPGASTDDYPRSHGLGDLAIRYRRPMFSYKQEGMTIHPAKQAAGARSLVCYPLIVGDEIVGVLYVYRCDERHFDELELLTLDNFVNLAAIAIHHGRQIGGLSRALARKVNELEKLERASRLISSRTNLDETLQEILSIGLDLTAAQYGSFELYDKKAGVLTIKALAGRHGTEASGPALPVDEQSVVGWVAKKRQSLLIRDLRDPRWQSVYQPLPADQEMRSELAVPLIGTGGGLEGVLNIESPLPNAFTAEDQHLLEALAVQAVIALQEMRLLDAMVEIVEVLLTAQGHELFKLIVERACELINVPVGAIWTLEEETQALILRQSTEGFRRGERLSRQRSLNGQAIRLRQAITVEDVRLHPDFEYQELAIEQGWVSAIVVPLLMPDEHRSAIGSFSLYANHLRDFSNWDKKLLTVLANHAAVAIHDAEQLAQLEQARQRQAVAETFAAVGDVAANLLHQLNNKVGAIPARVQGIEDKCPEMLTASPYLADNLREIEQSAQQAMSIVRDSLAHLRPVQRRSVDVTQCLNQALQRAEPPPSVGIYVTGFAALPPVRAGEQQLEMVFYNLIDNAIQAMAGQGELHVRGEAQGDEVVVTVTDTGPGIPPELEPHLFEFAPAEQMGPGSPARRLGFGLWWVKTLLDRFDGRLMLASEPEQGTTVQICLPIEKGQQVD